MNITCISASNTMQMGEKSTSTRVCNIFKEIIEEDATLKTSVEVLPLMHYNFSPCILCGKCFDKNECIYDKDFNKVYRQILESDAVVLVVPHYSTTPSKLTIIFEKINEILYSNWINNPEFKSGLENKPIVIIGHGGMGENDKVLHYYHDNLITPISKTLKSFSLDIIPYNDNFPNGTPFGLRDDACVKPTKNSIFPEIIQDYKAIKERITPITKSLINKLNKK